MAGILFPLSLKGRIGRLTFMKLAGVAIAPWVAIALLSDLSVIAGGSGLMRVLPDNWLIGLFVVTAWILIAAIVRRFQDRGRSKIWLIIPLAYGTWFAWDFVFASGSLGGNTPVLLRKLTPSEIQAAFETAKWTAIAVLTGLAFLSAPAIWMVIDLVFRSGEPGPNTYGPEPG